MVHCGAGFSLRGILVPLAGKRAEARPTFAMRLFTAIEIPDEVRSALRAVLAYLRPLANLRWSPVENLHITTKFIGEWPEARVAELRSALRQVAMAPIEIAIRGLGWFPNQKRPRVFYAGVESPPELGALAVATERALASIGVPVEDRPYRPHLTLARVKDTAPLNALNNAIANLPGTGFGSFRAVSQHLYLSAGGKYSLL